MNDIRYNSNDIDIHAALGRLRDAVFRAIDEAGKTGTVSYDTAHQLDILSADVQIISSRLARIPKGGIKSGQWRVAAMAAEAAASGEQVHHDHEDGQQGANEADRTGE